VFIPLYQDVPEWGSKWFPQTIYVEYGYYKDYPDIEWFPENEEYGIVAEYWFPNDVVKIHNVISKFLSVYLMFYVFIPRKKAGYVFYG